MALFAIGDLHLSFGVDKPMDKFGGGWKDYTEKIKTGFDVLNPDDVCVICGDVSWGMSLDESLEDFHYIDKLPGKKIILKGNHDYWWNTAAKMKAFFEANNITSIYILHNNCYSYGVSLQLKSEPFHRLQSGSDFEYSDKTAICGTRGWFFDDKLGLVQNEKVMAREVLRLRASLEAAAGFEEKICFFHYPPRYKNTVSYDIISIMNEFNVKRCYYGHLHGEGHKSATLGIAEGIDYEMVSADFINFTPRKVLG
ncbi:MAG: metallophosphoesterase [Oscillospiraceae bacterium]|nr:metallophosphoesterase [Oscillospiraceae bacterium]